MRSAAVEVVTPEEVEADPMGMLGRAVDDSIPVIVGRPRGESVVIISLSTWNSMRDELLTSQGSRTRLDESIAQADRGELIAVELGPDGHYVEAER